MGVKGKEEGDGDKVIKERKTAGEINGGSENREPRGGG